MRKYDIHPDFKMYAFSMPFSPIALKLSRLPQKLLLRAIAPKGVTVHKMQILSDGEKLSVEIYEPENSEGVLPGLVYLHGGGFGFLAAPQHKMMVCTLAKKANCRVIFPDYRLLPQYPYPAARTDVLTVYKWACENAAELRIDKNRIAVGGDSAGGALATYLCRDAEENGLPGLCFQMLLYPVTDARMDTESMRKYTDTPIWNTKNNKIMWRLYLNGKYLKDASPMQSALPKNIPDTYIEVAEFDCLHDEGIEYANYLSNSGANVSVNETKGTIHGYDASQKSGIVKACMDSRAHALQQAFQQSK